MDIVAYYRVSTQRQGRSGLGLDAQKLAVAQWAAQRNGVIIDEFTEVESGAGASKTTLTRRPQLREALERAKAARATLVIAKLDRLARNVHFISGLIETRIPIVAADMPDADVTMLQIYAVIAEREGRAISERTKGALQAARARGVELGRNGAVLAEGNKAEAAERLRPLQDTLHGLCAQGLTLRQMLDRLETSGISSPTGGRWHLSSLHRAIKRLKLR